MNRQVSDFPVLVAHPVGPWFSGLCELVSSGASPGLELIECATDAELAESARQLKRCVVVMHAAAPAELETLLRTLVVLNEAAASAKAEIRILCCTRPLEVSERAKLENSGCHEIIESQGGVSPKALLLKVMAQGRQLRAPGAALGPESKAQVSAAIPAKFRFRQVAALQTGDDCWIFQEGSVRRIADRWVIKLLGPGPGVGRWAEVASSGEERCWEWAPSDPNDTRFVSGKGSWRFTGNRPEFFEELWSFVGKRPELRFFSENSTEPGPAKVSVHEDGALLVAKDSQAALAKMSLIHASFEAALRRRLETVGGSVLAEALDQVERKPHQTKVPQATPDTGVSPLLAAFFLSELLGKRGHDAHEIARRFCRFLSRSSGGQAVELWIRTGDSWRREASENAGENSAREPGPAAIEVKNGDRVLGALVISDERYSSIGTGIGPILQGLFLSF